MSRSTIPIAACVLVACATSVSRSPADAGSRPDASAERALPAILCAGEGTGRITFVASENLDVFLQSSDPAFTRIRFEIWRVYEDGVLGLGRDAPTWSFFGGISAIGASSRFTVDSCGTGMCLPSFPAEGVTRFEPVVPGRAVSSVAGTRSGFHALSGSELLRSRDVGATWESLGLVPDSAPRSVYTDLAGRPIVTGRLGWIGRRLEDGLWQSLRLGSCDASVIALTRSGILARCTGVTNLVVWITPSFEIGYRRREPQLGTVSEPEVGTVLALGDEAVVVETGPSPDVLSFEEDGTPAARIATLASEGPPPLALTSWRGSIYWAVPASAGACGEADGYEVRVLSP